MTRVGKGLRLAQVRPHFKVVDGHWRVFWKGASGTLYLEESLCFMARSSTLVKRAKVMAARMNYWREN